MITELVILTPGYFLVAGTCRRVFFLSTVSNCPECYIDVETGNWMHRREKYGDLDARYRHSFEVFWTTVFWPITLPFIFGTRMNGHVRIDQRHRAEVLEAIHQRNLRRISAEEDALLNQQLKELEHGSDDHPRG